MSVTLLHYVITMHWICRQINLGIIYLHGKFCNIRVTLAFEFRELLSEEFSRAVKALGDTFHFKKLLGKYVWQ